MRKESLSRKIFVACNTLFMTVLMAACLYPIIYVLLASFSNANLLMANSGLLYKPLGFTFDAYAAVLKNPMIGRGYLNTLFVVVVGVCLSMTLSILGAYFLSRRDIMLKNFVMGMITVTMFFGGGLIPFYMTVKSLGMYNTIWALIIPSSLNTFNLIIMRTSFMSIPASLEESATIDGAGEWLILTKIIVPLSKAMLAVMVLFYGVGYWNSWFNAAIFLNERDLFPLQLVLREILLQNDTSTMTQNAAVADAQSVAETVKYAVIIVATVPILTVYPFLQKYFVQGVMVGALKG